MFTGKFFFEFNKKVLTIKTLEYFSSLLLSLLTAFTFSFFFLCKTIFLSLFLIFKTITRFFLSILFSTSNCVKNLTTLMRWNQGIIIKSNYFGGILSANEMHNDDLWWHVGENDAPPPKSNREIEVQPNPNPMVSKAEQIFRDALKK